MEDYNISKDFINESSTEKLLLINTYLMQRHAYFMKYEYYDKVEMIVDFMDDIDQALFNRFINGDSKFSKYLPTNNI